MGMKKVKSHAFGKDCYLIGRDRCNDLIWLEAAKWNCGWYWGFGYVEVYTLQSNPVNSRGSRSHSHWEGLVGKQEGGRFLHHVNEALVESVLTDDESWELADLMKSFYTLKEAAELLGRGGGNLTEKGIRDFMKDAPIVKQINEVMLPELFKSVYKLLEP